MSLHTLNPLSDSRWADLIARHPRASAFHEPGWLQALAQTYDYEPLVLTSASPVEPLQDGIVLCRISSWFTGTRLVSLPFSDHCDPLLNRSTNLSEFLEFLRTEHNHEHCRYVELRPTEPILKADPDLQESGSYCWHVLCLESSAEQIFEQFHHDSIQRKIRRAERERLSYEVGCSDRLAEDFYRLLLRTRRRHQLVPQPRAWFRNLIGSLGNKLQIRLARKNDTPVAALLTLKHRLSVVYKYGCSDERFHHLGGIAFLFWRLVEESKANGVSEIDLGRSDPEGEGLITFKNRLGGRRRWLKYYRYSRLGKKCSAAQWKPRIPRWFVRVLPDTVLSATGSMLYKHMG